MCRYQFRKPLSQLGIYLTRCEPNYEKATVLIRIYCGGICSRQLGRGKCLGVGAISRTLCTGKEPGVATSLPTAAADNRDL